MFALFWLSMNSPGARHIADHLLTIKRLLAKCLLLPTRKVSFKLTNRPQLSIPIQTLLVLDRSAGEVDELQSTCVVTARVTTGSTVKFASKPYCHPPFSFHKHPITVFMTVKLATTRAKFSSAVAPCPVLPFSVLALN